jgi:hypothetical protein
VLTRPPPIKSVPFLSLMVQEDLHRQRSSGRLVGRSYLPVNVSSSLKQPSVNVESCKGRCVGIIPNLPVIFYDTDLFMLLAYVLYIHSFGFGVHGNRFKGDPPLNDGPGRQADI